MRSHFFEVLNWLTRLGIHQKQLTQGLPSRIVVSNKISLLFSCVGVPYIFIFSFVTGSFAGLLLIPTIVCFLLCLFLNYLGKVEFSRLFPIIGLAFVGVTYPPLFGQEYGIQVILIIACFTSVSLFLPEEKLKILASVLISLMAFFITEVTNYSLFPRYYLSVEYTGFLYYAVQIGTIILALMIVKLLVDTQEQVFKNLKGANLALSQSRFEVETAYKRRIEDAEKQLSESEKAKSLMSLMNEYNHDIKAPMMVLSMKANDPSLRVEDLRSMILKQVKRVDSLLNRMISIVKEKEIRTNQELCINVMIQSALDMFPIRLGEKIITLKNVPNIMGDPEDLQILFINLLKNFFEAHAEESFDTKLTIESSYLEERDKVYIRVSDTGKGIPTQLVETLWGRKDVSHGHGLGLSVVRRIVEDHQADIELETEEGKGTTFHLYFSPLHKLNLNTVEIP